MTKKSTAIAILVLTAILFVSGIRTVSAQTPTDNPGLSIVQRISRRFGLKQSDVQSVFDQHRQHRQSEHRVILIDRLNQLAAEGKLNETQKQAILTKMQQMQTQKLSMMENFRTMTPEQRQAEMQKKQSEMKAWADSIGIDPSLLGGSHRGFGMQMGGMSR